MNEKFLGYLVCFIMTVSLTACGGLGSDTPKSMPPGEWDYIALGDSVCWSYPEILAEQIEADYEGVTVTFRGGVKGGQTAKDMLGKMQTSEPYREYIRNAELITIMIPMGGCREALITYEGGGDCGGEENEDCLRACIEEYKADTDEIFAELVKLRDPSEGLIRAHDLYQFHTSSLLDRGKFEVVNGYWLEANAHVVSVAESYGIPVANVYQAFMGDDGRTPPEGNGLLSPDMIHQTSTGAELIADLILELGYELAVP